VSSSGVTTSILPSRKVVEARVAAFQSLLASRPDALTSGTRARDLRDRAEILSRTLIDPVLSPLAGRHRLVIVPDGALHALSFAALAARGAGSGDAQWLGERFAISYVPSAASLAWLSRVPARTGAQAGLIAFGDPRFIAESLTPARAVSDSAPRLTELPFTRVEIERIAALFPSSSRRVYLGTDAREEAVKQAPLARYQYVHFAAHAFVNPARLGRSGIALAIDPASKEDGVLQADEVMRLQVDADLVTLSGCQTGLGRMIPGEGVMGLARAFLYAGSRSVAASLWNVNDSGSVDLMEQFYRGLVRGLPRDAALEGAERALIHSADPRLHDPYYWAPFVLIGTTR
jgi:CHAT domain-containing protein